MASPPDWPRLFADLAEPLTAMHWDTVVSQIQPLAPPGDPSSLGTLKRYARHALSDGPVDPWRVQLVLRRAFSLDPSGPTAALVRTSIPARGLLEPDLHLRAWALARAILSALADDTTLFGDLPSLHPIDGAREVWWWLTGRDEPSPASVETRRNLCAMVRAIDASLSPFHLIAPNARTARLALVTHWESNDPSTDAHPLQDPLVHAFQSAWTAEHALVLTALDVCRNATQSQTTGTAQDLATGLLAGVLSNPADGATPADLAGWCARACAIGIVAAAALRDPAVDRYQHQAADALIASLERNLPHQPLSLLREPMDYAFWKAVTVLLRERLDAGARDHVVRLLAVAADTGSWTERLSKTIAQITRLTTTAPLDPAHRGEILSPFVLRLAVTTARARKLTALQLWKKVLRRYADRDDDSPEATLLTRWWSPRTNPEPTTGHSMAALLALTAHLAGREITAPDEPAAIAWWNHPQQRVTFEPAPDGTPDAPINTVRTALSHPTPHHDTIHVALTIACSRNQYGEVYLDLKLFEHSPTQGVAVVADNQQYGRLVDHRERLSLVQRSLHAARERARQGRSPAREIQELQSRLEQLIEGRFWADVAARLATSAPHVLLSGNLLSLPWELTPTPTDVLPDDHPFADDASVPLGLLAPIARPQLGTYAQGTHSPFDRRPAEPGLLVGFDPGQAGSQSEALAVLSAWQSSDPGRPVTLCSTRREFELACRRSNFDVVHYTGHQGPAGDNTPSLSFSDGPLTLLRLGELLRSHPPRLLFLNACSTLTPSETVDEPDSTADNADAVNDAADAAGAAYMVFGALEPLCASTIPAVVGTLWDVCPPDDTFARAFYREVSAGLDFDAALHRARLEVAPLLQWAPWWSAYVMLTRA